MLGYSTANSEETYFHTNFSPNFDTLLQCRCIFWWYTAWSESGLGSLSRFQEECKHLLKFLSNASIQVYLGALKESVFQQFLGISIQPKKICDLARHISRESFSFLHQIGPFISLELILLCWLDLKSKWS